MRGDEELWIFLIFDLSVFLLKNCFVIFVFVAMLLTGKASVWKNLALSRHHEGVKEMKIRRWNVNFYVRALRVLCGGTLFLVAALPCCALCGEYCST